LVTERAEFFNYVKQLEIIAIPEHVVNNSEEVLRLDAGAKLSADYPKLFSKLNFLRLLLCVLFILDRRSLAWLAFRVGAKFAWQLTRLFRL
jgi:hypothetical protein